MKKIVIIGAGIGGLSAASYLSKAGFNVTVLEKNSWLGGRAQVWQEKGFTFDMGPTWYWMPDVFRSFYNDFGYQPDDFYSLTRLNPSYRIYFEDDQIDLPASRAGMCQLFEHFEKGAGKKLNQLLNKTQKVYQIAMRSFVSYPYTSYFNLLKPSQLTEGLKILACYNGFRSVKGFLASQFKNEKLIKILSFPIFFLGESTGTIPSVYSMMNHVDIDQGTWHPMGGFGQVINAFVSIAKQNGVTLVTDQEVTSITVNSRKACGVTTRDGSFYPADVVISNGDYHDTEFNLLPSGYASYSAKYWETLKLAPSALLIYLGFNKPLPGVLHHTLFFINDWQAHNDALFRNPVWPKNPLYYVSTPTKTDSSLAPNGKETVTILIPIAAGLADSASVRTTLVDAVLSDFEKAIKYPFRNTIEVKRVYALSDFISDYHAYKGNAYGLGQTAFQTAIFRPKFKSKKVSNLYYTGQFTVPGIGVPMVILSGKLVAKEISRHYGD